MSDQRRLVLLRHGRTAWNHVRRAQGQTDVDLDDVGREQAQRVAPALAALEPARVWCSDLARTRATAQPLLAATRLEASYDARLREFHLGEREGMTYDEYAVAHPDEHARFITGDFDAVRGGERTADVRARMTAVLGELLEATAPGELSVAVSHGAAIRVATAALLGWPEGQFATLRGLDNCCWVELVDEPDRGVRLAAYNRSAT